MMEISKKLRCSHSKIAYWMGVHSIKRRKISDSIYIKHNPKGDPFIFKLPISDRQKILFGIGLGLYWGEGTKANKYSVRLGNSDPKLILTFISFLETFFNINRNDMRFGLQIFNTINVGKAIKFWTKELKISQKQMMKVIVTPKRNEGTYKRKIEHGVMTLYFHNRKMRDMLNSEIENLKQIS